MFVPYGFIKEIQICFVAESMNQV